MDAEKKEFFRNKLETMRDEILQDAEKTISGMTDQNDNIPDPNDRATIESDRSFELRIRDRERKLLVKIQEALERLDGGTYGICESCGENIAEKRLDARPVTELCFDCKVRQEQDEKSRGA